MAHVYGSDNAVWSEEHDNIPLKQRLKLLLASKRFPGNENAALPPTSNRVDVKKEYDQLDSLDFPSNCSSEKSLTQEHTATGVTEETSPNQTSARLMINASGSASLLPSQLSNFPITMKVKIENPDGNGVSTMWNCANSSLVTNVQAIDKFNTQIPDDILDELDYVVLKERQRMLLSRKESRSAAEVLQDSCSGLFNRVVDNIVQRTETMDPAYEMVSGVPRTSQGFKQTHCAHDDKVKSSANLIQHRDIDPICSSDNILSKHKSSGGVQLLSGIKTVPNSKITELVNVKVEPLDSSQVERTDKGPLPTLAIANMVQVKTEFEIPDDSFEDKLDHMLLSERMNLLASKDLHHLNKCENSESSSKVVPQTIDFQPVAPEYVTPLKINRPRKRRKTATDSVGTALEEDAPGLLEVLIEKGVSVDEMKLYGQTEYDGVLDESSLEDSFSELEAVISKLFDQRNSLLKFAPVRCNKGEKASYCLACLFSLVEQARYLRFRSWPVEWGWCRDLQSFIFVFERHNRIVLERPEYGYATYFFELVDSFSVDWQVKRLVTAMKLTSCSRVTLIENKALVIGEDLTEGEARVLMEYGWIPNTGLGTMLNYCDRVVHDRKNETFSSEWRSKIGKLLVDGYSGGTIVSADIATQLSGDSVYQSPQIKLELN